MDFRKAMRQLYHRFIQPTVSMKKVEEWHATLMDSPSVLKYVRFQRGLSKEVIKRFMLGFDGTRITIPIADQFGLIVDVRRYDFTKKLPRKIISYKKGYGTARLFPVDNLLTDKPVRILLCEGEWDAMLAIDRGYRAVTVTSGAGNWPDPGGPNDVTPMFEGKSVRIVYDVNDVNSQGQRTDAGQIGAQKVADILAPVAKSVKVVELPIPDQGGDITDWFMKHGKTKVDLDAVIESTKTASKRDPAAPPEPEKPKLPRVRLDEAADSKLYFQPVEMDCLISGKNLSPYLAPKKVKMSMTDPKSGDVTEEIGMVDTARNKDLLRLVNCGHNQLKGALCDMFGVGGEGTTFETLETFNMEELSIIPAINLKELEGTYAIRRALYLGHGLESNRTYRMTGYSLPDPDTQESVHVITEAIPVQDAVENFQMSEETYQRLVEQFTPKDSVSDHMYSIAGWLSRNVTSIRKRPDLHIAVDLVFHSALTFNFNGEEVNKGWLELLVIGDTRCGKGYVAERMSKFYRLGETVTGENCSFAGLIGGLNQSAGKHWYVTWGKIPLSDKRLVIIDEASNLSYEMIGQMSRVRSEGVAEVVKIRCERTRARTRLIWLSNPRSGNAINTYNNGVEAIKELMGNMEDISRLDFALTVATNEVPSKVINAAPQDIRDEGRFQDSDFTNLVMWAWSRKPDQIQFTERATQMILEVAIKMGRTYSPAIPLVQAENVRIKLAKIAVAVAARCFSTPDGEDLVVKSHHVQFAYEFLTELYSKPSMGYDVFSSASMSRNQISNDEAVIKTIYGLKRYARDFVEGMMGQSKVTSQDMCDFSGTDRMEIQDLVGKLVRLRCLAKDGEYYVKRPGFMALLKSIHDDMKKED
jgi:hypothetical protein